MSDLLKALVVSLAVCNSALVIGPAAVTVASAQAGPDCGPCDVFWLSQLDFLGTFECAHGPEYDKPDCDNNPCCENNPGGCPMGADGLNNNVCSCYTCGKSDGCEPYITKRHVWCNSLTEDVQSSCEVETITDVDMDIAWMIVIDTIPYSIADGCGLIGGLEEHRICGQGIFDEPFRLSCRAAPGSCILDPDAQPRMRDVRANEECAPPA